MPIPKAPIWYLTPTPLTFGKRVGVILLFFWCASRESILGLNDGNAEL